MVITILYHTFYIVVRVWNEKVYFIMEVLIVNVSELRNAISECYWIRNVISQWIKNNLQR